MKYKRIVLKLSGEMFSDETNKFSYEKALNVCKNIKKIRELGTEIIIIIGGGNYWRGRQNTDITEVTSDYIGMIATIMNSLSINDILNKISSPSKIVTNLKINDLIEEYNKRKVNKYLNKEIVVCAGGTGKPYCSTDTAAVSKAIDLKANLIIKMTKVDGVYDKDPMKYKNSKKYAHLTYEEVIEKDLQVMDIQSISNCQKVGIPIVVTNMDFSNIAKIINGNIIGTIIESKE